MCRSMLVAELLLALVAVAGTVVAAVRLYRCNLRLRATGLATERLGHVAEERARRIERAREIAQVVGNTSSAVGLGTDVVQASHTAIASIPFDVLESFGPTRGASKIIRGIHDETTAGVYRAINSVNRAIGDAFRAREQSLQPSIEAAPPPPIKRPSQRESFGELEAGNVIHPIEEDPSR